MCFFFVANSFEQHMVLRVNRNVNRTRQQKQTRSWYFGRGRWTLNATVESFMPKSQTFKFYFVLFFHFFSACNSALEGSCACWSWDGGRKGPTAPSMVSIQSRVLVCKPTEATCKPKNEALTLSLRFASTVPELKRTLDWNVDEANYIHPDHFWSRNVNVCRASPGSFLFFFRWCTRYEAYQSCKHVQRHVGRNASQTTNARKQTRCLWCDVHVGCLNDWNLSIHASVLLKDLVSVGIETERSKEAEPTVLLFLSLGIWSPDVLTEDWWLVGVSENSVPLNPMVNDHYPY